MTQDLIAVVDVGKTNAKLILVNGETGASAWSRGSHPMSSCRVTARC